MVIAAFYDLLQVRRLENRSFFAAITSDHLHRAARRWFGGHKFSKSRDGSGQWTIDNGQWPMNRARADSMPLWINRAQCIALREGLGSRDQG
jgi:hypothetical protein